MNMRNIKGEHCKAVWMSRAGAISFKELGEEVGLSEGQARKHINCYLSRIERIEEGVPSKINAAMALAEKSE